MRHSALHAPQEHDLYGLLYGYAFRAGEPVREIDSSEALRWLTAPAEIPRRLAASTIPPKRPPASKTCRARKEGKLFIGISTTDLAD